MTPGASLYASGVLWLVTGTSCAMSPLCSGTGVYSPVGKVDVWETDLPMQKVPPLRVTVVQGKSKEPMQLGTSVIVGVARTMLKAMTKCVCVCFLVLWLCSMCLFGFVLGVSRLLPAWKVAGFIFSFPLCKICTLCVHLNIFYESFDRKGLKRWNSWLPVYR